MKRIIYFLTLCLLPVFAVAADQITTLEIIPLTGSEQLFAISQIGQLTFDGDWLILKDKQGATLGSKRMSDIKRIEFTTDQTTAAPTLLDNSLTVLPVSNESLLIKGLQQPTTARVYSIQGQLLITAPLADTESILTVGSLTQGIYLLQIDTQVIKFQKR